MDQKQSALSMWKYSISAFFSVMVLNWLAHQVLKLNGAPVTVAIAFAVGGFVTLWFAKSEKRMPTSSERSFFLWQYAGSVALLFGIPFLLVAMSGAQPITIWGPLIILVHWVAYPLCAYLYMSEKYLGKQLKSVLAK